MCLDMRTRRRWQMSGGGSLEDEPSQFPEDGTRDVCLVERDPIAAHAQDDPGAHEAADLALDAALAAANGPDDLPQVERLVGPSEEQPEDGPARLAEQRRRQLSVARRM
jgi:hypothetical protein